MNTKMGLALAVGLAGGLLTGPADAQATRTWVSGVGDDANPCSRTAPCKTFASAIGKTAIGGEISVLDAGAYGAVTISKSVTINGEGTLASILASAGNGIVVQAGAGGVVTLRNLQINGAGTVFASTDGIRVLSASAVIVEDCAIYGFDDHGINFMPTVDASLFVKDTVLRNNGSINAGGGIRSVGTASASARVFLDNVRLERNTAFGMKALEFSTVNIRNSAAVGNSNNGFWASSSSNQPTEMNIETSRSSGNGVGGVRAEGTASVVRLSGVTVTNNLVGFHTGSGGQIESFGNNYQIGNGANNAPNATIPPQ